MIAAPVAVEQFPRRRTWAEDTSPPPDPDPVDVWAKWAPTSHPAPWKDRAGPQPDRTCDRSLQRSLGERDTGSSRGEKASGLPLQESGNEGPDQALGSCPGRRRKGTNGFDGQQTHGNTRSWWTPVCSDPSWRGGTGGQDPSGFLE